MDPAKTPTPSPEEQRRLARADADIRRHLVMKGLPPTGSTSPLRSAEEHRRRIERLMKRAKESRKLWACPHGKAPKDSSPKN